MENVENLTTTTLDLYKTNKFVTRITISNVAVSDVYTFNICMEGRTLT